MHREKLKALTEEDTALRQELSELSRRLSRLEFVLQAILEVEKINSITEEGFSELKKSFDDAASLKRKS